MCRILAAKSFTPVRPILMQLDLQSVEKVPFSSFAGAFAPKMLEIGLPRLSRSRSFPQDLSRAVFLFSRGPFAANHHQHFSDPTGSNTTTISDRIEITNAFSIRWTIVIVFDPQLDRKSGDGGFLQLGPWRSGKQLLMYLGESSTHSEARKINFQHLRGATGYKSNCIRIGVMISCFFQPNNLVKLRV